MTDASVLDVSLPNTGCCYGRRMPIGKGGEIHFGH